MSVFAKTSAGKSNLNPHNKGNEKGSFFGVQAKLNIGKSNDKFEAEADSVADKVISNKKNTAPEAFFTPSPVVQSKASAELNSQNKNGEIQKKNAVEGISTVVQPKLKVVHNKGANSDSFFHASPVMQNKRTAEIQKKDNPEKEVQKKPEIKKVVPVVQLKLEKEESVQSKIESPKTKDKSNVSQPVIQQKKEEDIQKKNAVEKVETTQNKTESVQTEKPKTKEKILPPKPLIQKKKEEEIQAKEEEEIQAKEDEKELQMSSASDTPSDTSNLESTLNSSKGGGSPLSGKVKTEMESGIGADFSNVRIHNDSNAVKMNQQLGAQAFATGNNIYFNEGKYNPNSQDGKHLLAHELTHTVQQGAAIRKKPEPISPAPEMIQGSFLDLVPNWIIDRARHIPGYTLFTVIVGYDPLRQVDVERTPINLVEGLMGLIPFGTAIFDKLQEYGILQQVFDWVEGKLGELGLTIDSILDLVEDVWHQLSFPYRGIIDLITEKFNELVNRITSFVSATVDQVITWIKEALIDVAEPILAENKAWSLIKKIIKYDPLRDEEVTATTVEILEDFLILIDKQTELEQMKEKGTLQKTADWLDTQVGTFTSLLGELRGLITAAWDAIQPSNLVNIADNLSALAAQAGGFLQRVWDFASGVALKVLELVKDSLLAWLSSQAATVRGYSLIKVIIGRDPFTNETVERTIPNVIRGFMSLMDGGEEQYAQMVETGAIARITGQIEAAVATLNMTPQAIIQLFTDLWNSFTIDDLIHPLDAFVRIIEKFGEPIGRLIAFVAEIIRIVIVAILEIMNFPFDLIGNIITRAMQAIEDIKKDPIGFLKNILRAIKQGFVQFFDNIVTHLISGVTGWLMSELRDANLPVLTDFSLRGVISWVLEVLGISMEKIWEKLAAHPRIGPARVARIRGMINTLEGIWTFIKDVQERGMAAIWDKIQEQLSNLWNTVLDAVKNFIMERIINRITARLLSMLDPTGIMAVINGAMALYNAIQSFIKYLREMLEVVNSFVNGVADIAKGNVTTAANYLERTMGEAMPIVIGFLANQVGLSGIGARIGEMIISVQQMVDEALTWLVNQAVDRGMALLDRVMGRGEPEAATPSGPIAGALAEIDSETEKENDEGEVTAEEAQAIKNKVNTDQSSVINISSVTDGGETWDYNYVQLMAYQKPKKKKTEIKPPVLDQGRSKTVVVDPLTNLAPQGGSTAGGRVNRNVIAGNTHIDTHIAKNAGNQSEAKGVHILSASLFGPASNWNLVFGSQSLNTNMDNGPETIGKNNKNKTLKYSMTVNYYENTRNDAVFSLPSPSPAQLRLALGFYIAESITAKVDEVNGTTVTSLFDNDVPGSFPNLVSVPALAPEVLIVNLLNANKIAGTITIGSDVYTKTSFTNFLQIASSLQRDNTTISNALQTLNVPGGAVTKHGTNYYVK
ncbi:eCIS core domain-containing protein [Flavobacterium defluvii]|uniref:eCIS core domain-containing protein n=1 Tax=Flavobacterium defluvii TaxID=370979 RepID=A0A1M5E4U5_9FLAO|nr:DUF4157 domain-containing protein [Flavobacterium defluvii]SHF74268.1 protein of unknown function [Flavobacterium defluvii]